MIRSLLFAFAALAFGLSAPTHSEAGEGPTDHARSGYGTSIGWGDDLQHYGYDFDCNSTEPAELSFYFWMTQTLENVTELKGHIDFCTAPLPLVDYFRFEPGAAAKAR